MKRFGVVLGLSLAFSMAGCGAPGTGLSLGSTGSTLGAQSLASEHQAPRSVVRIFVQNHDQVQALARKGLDLFENVNMRLGYVDATVNERDARFLQANGYRFKVTGSASPQPATFGAFGLEAGYHTVDNLQTAFQQMAKAHPKIARYSVIGKSLKGNDIFMLEISGNPGNTPQILFDSGQHARELPPVELTYRLANLLLSSYGQDPAITKLVDTRDIFIVPVVNPDGRKDVEAGDTFWRKNLRNNGDGTMGVDTNRNSDDHWDQGDKDGNADDFGGSAPDSEPETRALRDLTASHHFTIALDIHNYAGMVLYPPGYTTADPADIDTFNKIGHHIADPIGYQAGTIAQLLYNTYGDLSTWQYDKYGVIAMGVELNDSGFNAPFSEVDTDWNQWKNNFTWLIGIADNPRAQAARLSLPASSNFPTFRWQ